MIIKIYGEAPFQVLASNFTISPAESSYVLQVSADGKEYSDLFAVAANTTRMVTGVAAGSFYRLKNNTGDVSVNWRKCSGSDGSDGTANELKPMEDLPLTADEGAVSATEDGLYQNKDGVWTKIGDGEYLPLTGGTLSGNLTLGDSTTTSYKKVETIRSTNDTVNGAAFYVNNDGTAAFFHKKYNGTSATNDAILKFNATNGLQFAANPNGTATEFKDVLVDGKVKTINGESIVGEGDIKVSGGDEPVFLTMNEDRTELLDDEGLSKVLHLINGEESFDGYAIYLKSYNNGYVSKLVSSEIRNGDDTDATLNFDGYVVETYINQPVKLFKSASDSNTFVITTDEETGDFVATGFNAAYEAAGGNLTVLFNTGVEIFNINCILDTGDNFILNFINDIPDDFVYSHQLIITYSDECYPSEQDTNIVKGMNIGTGVDVKAICSITQEAYDNLQDISNHTLYIITD